MKKKPALRTLSATKRGSRIGPKFENQKFQPKALQLIFNKPLWLQISQ